jgi:hypothetical protein
MEWGYFVLGMISYQIIKMVVVIARNEKKRHDEKLFLRQVKVLFPDNQSVTMTAIETSDRKAMRDLQTQLRMEADLHADDDDDYEMEPFPERP